MAMFKEAVVKFPFEKLAVYEKGMDLALKVHEVVSRSSDRSVGLGILEENALGLPLKIAEATACAEDRSKAQALRAARGGCFQLVPLIEMARRNEALSEGSCEDLVEEIERLSLMLGNLIFSLEEGKPRAFKSERRGKVVER